MFPSFGNTLFTIVFMSFVFYWLKSPEANRLYQFPPHIQLFFVNQTAQIHLKIHKPLVLVDNRTPIQGAFSFVYLR